MYKNKYNMPCWQSFVDDTLTRRQQQLVMFSKSYSPECFACKRSLQRLDCINEDNFFFTDIERRADCSQIETYLLKFTSTVRREVPLFFLRGRYVGGYKHIMRAEMDGRLEDFIWGLLEPEPEKHKPVCREAFCAKINPLGKMPFNINIRADFAVKKKVHPDTARDTKRAAAEQRQRIADAIVSGIQKNDLTPSQYAYYNNAEGNVKYVTGKIRQLSTNIHTESQHNMGKQSSVDSFQLGSTKHVPVQELRSATSLDKARLSRIDQSTMRITPGDSKSRLEKMFNEVLVNKRSDQKLHKGLHRVGSSRTRSRKGSDTDLDTKLNSAKGKISRGVSPKPSFHAITEHADEAHHE